MIFSNLFTPAHKHSDAVKRRGAISKLDSNSKTSKEILHEMAFNDVSADVSKAALEKLASFTLWLKAYESHIHSSVQKIAKAQVLKLIEDESQVSGALFSDIIQQERHKELVREMLFSSERLLNDSALCVSSVLTLCADNDVRRFYSTRATEQHKRIIVDAADDKQLRRLKKLSNSTDLAKHIDSRIAELEEQAALPGKVAAAATLINSRLLALCDLLDYRLIDDTKQALEREFDAIKSDFVVLDEEKSSELSSKYLMLREKVDKRLASLEKDYMAHLHLKAISDALSDIEGRAKTIFEQVDILGQGKIDEQLEDQLSLFKRSIEDLSVELDDLNLAQTTEAEGNEAHGTESVRTPDHGDNGTVVETSSRIKTTGAQRKLINKLNKSFERYAQQLDALPEIVARNQEAAELVLVAQALLEPSDSNENESPQSDNQAPIQDDTQNGAQADTQDSIEAVLSKLKALFSPELSEQNRNDIKSVQKIYKAQKNEKMAEVKALEKRCFSKLNAAKGMIESGKFKGAIATFNSAQKLVEQLAEQTKVPVSLNKRYEQIQEKVIELKDLQSYIAAPKKPELINLATALAENTDIDVSERANLVKLYRKEFISIGRLHTKEDDELNSTFDQVIEKAFEPCRKHYAKLDELREQNLQKGHQVLQALDALSEVEDPKVLSKHLSAISQQYRKLGDLDRQAREELHKQYQARYKPLQQRVNAFYQSNADAKQALVNKALSLVEAEDAHIAADEAKNLQVKWKNIGFAGAKQDQELWSNFREANDAVFARLKAAKEDSKRELSAQKSAIHEKLNAFASQVDAAKSLSDLGDVEAQIQDIQSSINELSKTQQRDLLAKLKVQQTNLQDKAKSFESRKRSDAMQTVFSSLDAFTSERDETFNDQLKSLPANFKQAFEASLKAKQLSPVLKGMERQELTIAADILLAEGEGFTESAQKKGVQLKLMAAKLEGEAVPNAEVLLLHWIQCGELQAQDHDLLAKLKTLYNVS